VTRLEGPGEALDAARGLQDVGFGRRMTLSMPASNGLD
jgi:hypothetical protein